MQTGPKRFIHSLIPVALIITACLLYRFVFMQGKGYDRSFAQSVQETDETHFTCTYAGITHDVIVDLPEEAKNAPLIVMLHGYGNSGESFRLETGFEKQANPAGYAVAYVTGSANPEDLTSAVGWNSGLGDSETDDVAFLKTLVKYLQDRYSLRRDVTFAVGFSNGAFMAHRLAVEASDTFPAVVCVAGMMPESIWEEKDMIKPVSVFQVTGEKDDLVPKNADGSAKYAKAPAIEDVIAFYVETDGLTLTGEEATGKKGTLTKYGGSGTKCVWDLSIKDGRHSWPDEGITGIDINALIIAFLDTQK